MCIFKISFSNFTLDNLTTVVVGIGSVFLLLLVISFCISLLKYLPKIFEKKEPEQKQESKSIGSSDADVPLDSKDGKALIAVITAAVYAFNESNKADCGPRDEYVVRSIRRVAR